MEFDQNYDDPEFFEEAYIQNVDVENDTTSHCHRRGTFTVLQILC
jgi:hypothetical protein